MSLFLYRALDPNGRKRSGEIEASDLAAARFALSQRGETVVDLRVADQALRFQLERSRGLSVRVAAAFATELAALLKAGAPLRRALDILGEGRTLTAALARDLAEGVDQGQWLSRLLESRGGAGPLLARFVEAGEAGAGMSEMCAKAGGFLKARADVADQVRGALAYPLFVILLAVAAVLVIVLVVAPALAPALEQSESAALVLGLASMGRWLSANASVLLACAAGILGVVFLLRGRLRLEWLFSTAANAVPLVRDSRRDFSGGAAAEVLAALIDAGTPVADALDVASGLAGGPVGAALRDAAERIRDGSPASEAIGAVDDLPLEVRRLAQLGEASGSLGLGLAEAGRLCRARALRRVERASAVAGPALVVTVGGIVSGLMILVLTSLTSIGEGAL
ncbi:MAG: type II secretion system F family protein [Pseudomonadota bacterium]